MSASGIISAADHPVSPAASSPERCLKQRLRRSLDNGYVTDDRFAQGVDVTMDLADFPSPDQYSDFPLASQDGPCMRVRTRLEFNLPVTRRLESLLLGRSSLETAGSGAFLHGIG